MDQFEGVESDYDKVVAASVGTALLYLDVSVVHTKNMLNDFGQKWFHTIEQFETNRLFARARNPELESITTGPGIFNVLKRQVNAYGQLATYESACSKLVPKPVAQPKTD
jgi:hypothetical protein